jgi:ribonuclease Z
MNGDREFFTLATEHLTIEGRSRAGHETWFRVRELGLSLDIGRCPDAVIHLPHIFVTHAHLDHAVGIPFYAGQRRLQRLPGGTVYVPAESAADFRELMKLHEKLEGTTYEIDIVGMADGETVTVGRTHRVRAHRATHRVAARAYEVLELRHHLKKEYAGYDGAELAKLRQQGIAVTEDVAYPILFYTGDTDRGILENNEAIYRAEVLMIECSFVMDGHQLRAEKYRHIHFDDLADFADRFENQIIVLTHFSRRYSREEIRAELRRRCPAVLRDRIRLALPEPFVRL